MTNEQRAEIERLRTDRIVQEAQADAERKLRSTRAAPALPEEIEQLRNRVKLAHEWRENCEKRYGELEAENEKLRELVQTVKDDHPWYEPEALQKAKARVAELEAACARKGNQICILTQENERLRDERDRLIGEKNAMLAQMTELHGDAE